MPVLRVSAQHESHDQAAMTLRVRSALYLLRGQFGAVTETWVGSTPNTPPPSGHSVTERTFTVLDG